MNDLLTIGQFSQACRLSVKTLRRYADTGLLVPGWVDPGTGYRYYRPIQAADAERIRLLRDLDLPLTEVRRILAINDPDEVTGILDAHAVRLEQRIATHQRALERLRQLRADPLPQPEVRHVVRSAMPALTLRLTTDLPGLGRAIGPTFGRIGRCLARQGARPSGTPFARYHVDSFDPDELDVEIGIPTADPIESEGPLQALEVAGGPWVTSLHLGPYEHITEAYTAVFAWMAERGLERCGPVMESYVVTPKNASHPGEYRTEILLPVDRLPEA